jgi:hypothetical protein
MLCWICRENEGNSFEHKFKSSDLKEFFIDAKVGNYLRQGDKNIPLQSHRSKFATHNNPICTFCNNDLTSAHDKSYEKISSHISLNSIDRMYRNGFIDFKEIYGENWNTEVRNLIKYISKQIGCRLDKKFNHDKLKPLSDFILSNKYPENLKIVFGVNQGLLALALEVQMKHQDLKFKHLFNGETIMHFNSKSLEFQFHGWMTVKFFTIDWIYSITDKLKYASNSLNQIQKLNIKSVLFGNRNEQSDHLIDWCEDFERKNDKDRLSFMNKLIKNCY